VLEAGRPEGLLDVPPGFGEVSPAFEVQGDDLHLGKGAGRLDRFGGGEREVRRTDFRHSRRAHEQDGSLNRHPGGDRKHRATVYPAGARAQAVMRPQSQLMRYRSRDVT